MSFFRRLYRKLFRPNEVVIETIGRVPGSLQVVEARKWLTAATLQDYAAYMDRNRGDLDLHKYAPDKVLLRDGVIIGVTFMPWNCYDISRESQELFDRGRAEYHYRIETLGLEERLALDKAGYGIPSENSSTVYTTMVFGRRFDGLLFLMHIAMAHRK